MLVHKGPQLARLCRATFSVSLPHALSRLSYKFRNAGKVCCTLQPPMPGQARHYSMNTGDDMEKLKSLPPLRDHFSDKSALSSDYWDYSPEYGPNTWKGKWPYGKAQSPIHIKPGDASYDPALQEDNLNFDTVSPFHVKLGNSGLTVKCHPSQNRHIPYIFGGPLECNYEFVELHFHWGKTDCKGSEHIIGDRSYPAEAHLVHWNKKAYKTFEEAKSSPNGLAVLGVFLELSETCSTELEAFTNDFSKILYKNSTFHLANPFNPYFLAPLHSLDYWTYKGSLTTPPCTENVTWILFRETFPVTREQLQRFRGLKAVEYKDKDADEFYDPMGSGCPLIGKGPPGIGDNFRPVLPIHGRQIRASFSE